LNSIVVFVSGVVVGMTLHAAIRPALRKLSGGYFFREGDKLTDEFTGTDSPGQ
jgi:hypothetical protein